jgi:hypothetical protein
MTETAPTTTDNVSIGFSRKLSLAFAVLFAAVAASGAWDAVSSGRPLRAVVVLLLFGAPAALLAVQALQRDPVLVLDDQGLTDVRGGRSVRWQEIEAAHVAHRGPRCHDLVLTLARGQTLRLSLDQLTRRWPEIARLTERSTGRRVAVETELFASARRALRTSLAS